MSTPSPSNESHLLKEVETLTIALKRFNESNVGIYPKLTRKRAIELCNQNQVALYSFATKPRSRSRIYIKKSIDFEDLISKYFNKISL